MRIVSLLPSATEIVYSLGLEDRLAGVTDECEVRAPAPRIVVRSTQPPGLSQAEIDAWVSARAAAGGLYVLDDAAMAEIRPDLVLTQDLCRVCAVPTDDVDAALARVACPSEVVTLEPSRLADVLASVRTVAAAAGCPQRGDALYDDLQRRITAVAEAVADRARPRAAVLEWLDPPYVAGHWVPEVIEAAGGAPLLGRPGRPSVRTTWDAVRDARPEVLVLAPCGTDPRDATAQWTSTAPPDLRAVPAVAVDLARPGPGLVDRIEALAAVFHPDADLPTRPDLAVCTPVHQ